MKNTFGSVAYSMQFSLATIKNLCHDFNINLANQFIGKGFVMDSIIKEEFVEFLKLNREFISKYQEDYYSVKTPEIISKTIKREENEIISYLKIYHPRYFTDGIFNENLKYSLRYVSSYKIDLDLGGNYDFLKIKETNNTKKGFNYSKLGIIGYEDILHSILEQVDPILDPNSFKEWGLNNPGGILLFGPPGCGKTFWAKNIGKLINYDFEEIPRSLFGSTFVDGAMINLKKKLNEFEDRKKVILFFDEFDSIASVRNNLSNGNSENSKVVNTLLQEIPKLIDKQILIIGATNYLEHLDTAVIRPGRFDLKIPVFPPNIDEKSKIIVHELHFKLNQDSPLLKILEFNKADNEVFWLKIASEMVLFSTSLVIDFTQLLKRKLKSLYLDKHVIEIKIEEDLLKSVLNETSSKFTKKDAEFFAQFYNEVKGLGSNFYEERMDRLLDDLNIYFSKFKDSPPKPIGFRSPNLH